MHKIMYPSLLWLLPCLLLTACRPEWYEALRSAPVPVIDGRANDWPAEAIKSHDRAPISYAFRQDQTHAYLLLRTDDPVWQQQILMAGLTCFLAADGGSSRRGIRFPMGLDPSNRPSDPNELNGFLGRLYANREALLGTMQDLELLGFQDQGKDDVILTDNPSPQGLMAAAKVEDASLTWEMVIPLHLLPGAARGDRLDVHWETGALDRPEHLRGSDAAGLGGNTPGTPTEVRGQSERDWLARLDRFRSFASPREAKVRVKLPLTR
jgi:hypothetical protein